jgi:ubiquinone/menaquinone biosynthesis C-methylase UbiE
MDPERVTTHKWDWWAYRFRVVHRSGIPGIQAWDDQLVAFIVEVLGLGPGARILDVGCGSGEHARKFARRGMEVVGIDVAPSLVQYCIERSVAEGVDGVSFVLGDMRALDSEPALVGGFDAVVVLSASFGFFDDVTNQSVLSAIARVLGQGGRVLLQLTDPLTFATRQRQGMHQEERPEGSYWAETWFDPATFTSHSRFRFTDLEGMVHLWEDRERIRVYTLPELRRMMRDAGLRLIGAYGDVALPPRPYGVDCSRQLIVVGERSEGEVPRVRAVTAGPAVTLLP